MADKVWVVAPYDVEAGGPMLDAWGGVVAFTREEDARTYRMEKSEHLRSKYDTYIRRQVEWNEQLAEHKRLVKEQNKALKAAGAPLLEVRKGRPYVIESFETWLESYYTEGWRVVEVELR